MRIADTFQREGFPFESMIVYSQYDAPYVVEKYSDNTLIVKDYDDNSSMARFSSIEDLTDWIDNCGQVQDEFYW